MYVLCTDCYNYSDCFVCTSNNVSDLEELALSLWEEDWYELAMTYFHGSYMLKDINTDIIEQAKYDASTNSRDYVFIKKAIMF